jgi:hypothetical protein
MDTPYIWQHNSFHNAKKKLVFSLNNMRGWSFLKYCLHWIFFFEGNKILGIVGGHILPSLPCMYSYYCPWHYVAVPHAGTARILIGMNLVGQIIFLFIADYIHWGQSTVTAVFALSYLTVSLLQVSGRCQRYTIQCQLQGTSSLILLSPQIVFYLHEVRPMEEHSFLLFLSTSGPIVHTLLNICNQWSYLFTSCKIHWPLCQQKWRLETAAATTNNDDDNDNNDNNNNNNNNNSNNNNNVNPP